jgi:hypothetical protein
MKRSVRLSLVTAAISILVSVHAQAEPNNIPKGAVGYETLPALSEALQKNTHEMTQDPLAKDNRPVSCSPDALKEAQTMVDKYYGQNMKLMDRLRKIVLESQSNPKLESLAKKEYSDALMEQALMDKYVHGNSFKWITSRAVVASWNSADPKSVFSHVISDLNKLKSQKTSSTFALPSSRKSFDSELDETLKFVKDQQSKTLKPGEKDERFTQVIARLKEVTKKLTPIAAVAPVVKKES